MSQPESVGDNNLYRVFNEIGIIDQLSGAAFRKVLPRPLNQAMFGVLNHLVRLGDNRTPSGMAAAFQVTRPSMTATVAKLEAAGLVEVRGDPVDARTKRVFLTDAGRSAREEAVARATSLFAELRPGWSDEETATLLPLLEKLRALLDEARN